MSRHTADPCAYETLVLGIGNVLWADEGFGVRALETLNNRYRFGHDVCVMDGGTQGIFLLPFVRSAKRLLIFDAVDFGLEPGVLKVVRGDDVPRFMGVRKMSMHQAGFQEVLSTAALSGDLPGEIVLIGVQPELLDDYGGSLRPVIKAQIDTAVELAIAELSSWNIAAEQRNNPPGATDLVGPGALDMHDYEAGRPQFPGD